MNLGKQEEEMEVQVEYITDKKNDYSEKKALDWFAEKFKEWKKEKEGSKEELVI